LMRADLQQLRGAAQLFARPIGETYELLVSEAERVAPHDGTRAGRLFAHASLISLARGRIDNANECAHRGLAADGRGPDSPPARLLAATCPHHGDVAGARRLLDPQLPSLLALEPHGEHSQLIAAAAQSLAWLGEWDVSERLFRRVVDAARAAGALSLLPFALSQQAEFELRRGHVATSYAAAS